MKEPKIRFKGFSEEWEETTLANVGKCFSGIGFPETEQGKKKGIPFYKVSDMNNIGNEKVMSNSNNYVTEEQVNKNGWKVCNDVPAIYFAKVGAAVLLNRKRLVLKPCLCDNNTMLYSLDKKVWDTYFCQSYFETIDLASLVQVGSLPSYNASMVGEVNVSLPDIGEQKALGAYFQHLDNLIQSTTKKIKSLKQVKAASLQSMFPQEGETTPRVRFKGFEGEWEKVAVSTLLEERREFEIMSDEYPLKAFIAYVGVSEKGERYDRSSLVNDVENKVYKKTDLGDFIYSSNNLETGSIGLNKYGKATISPVYSIFKCTEKSYSGYIGCAFTCKDFINKMVKWRQGVMYGQWRIHESDFLKIDIFVPSFDEQRCIGNYFTNLDRQITLQTQRLEKLKQIKAACLDNMFV